MNRDAAAYLEGIPQKPYDLLREGIIVFCVVLVLVLLLAIGFGSPDYPTVRGEDVAQRQPLAFLKTTANILAGNSSLEGYGPPYTPDTANAQRVLGMAPANWFGVTTPIQPAEDLVLQPLARVAHLNSDVAAALQTYQAASADQQAAWATAYLTALDTASVTNGQVQLPPGDYGPVAVMLNGMLQLGQAGLLEGALASSASLPFVLDFTRALLYFQDDVDHSVAESLNMLGDQWGISHETGNYPGAWWLMPYTFLYQIPPMSTSANGDLLVVFIVFIVLVLIPLFAPFLPIVNRLPIWLGVYKIIWRDWYSR